MDFNKLKGHVPDKVIAELPTIVKFKIDTPIEVAHFLSQCGHESGGFKAVQENLNYGRKTSSQRKNASTVLCNFKSIKSQVQAPMWGPYKFNPQGPYSIRTTILCS